MTNNLDTDAFLLIGHLVGSFGVHGHVKLKAITDQPDHIEQQVRTLYIRPKTRLPFHRSLPVPYSLVQATIHKPGLMILALQSITTRDAAEQLRQAEVYILESDARPLAEDEYFLHQLYGLHVISTDGNTIGEVSDVLETGANNVLVVKRTDAPDALIPIIHDIVKEIHVADGRIVIALMDGLLDE